MCSTRGAEQLLMAIFDYWHQQNPNYPFEFKTALPNYQAVIGPDTMQMAPKEFTQAILLLQDWQLVLGNWHLTYSGYAVAWNVREHGSMKLCDRCFERPVEDRKMCSQCIKKELEKVVKMFVDQEVL